MTSATERQSTALPKRTSPLRSWMIRSGLSTRTIAHIKFDLMRFRARVKRYTKRNLTPSSPKLHLGCGSRRVHGWLNVDVQGSDCDVDLACGQLPWRNDAFDTVVSQHVIEHLEIHTELLPLLAELNRVMKPGAEIWLSCPDMKKVCELYVNGNINTLLSDRQVRFPEYSLSGLPDSQMVNDMFHQRGHHKNLYDLDLLRHLMESNGFTDVRRVDEQDLLDRFPQFPRRGDDLQSLYVTAVTQPNPHH